MSSTSPGSTESWSPSKNSWRVNDDRNETNRSQRNGRCTLIHPVRFDVSHQPDDLSFTPPSQPLAYGIPITEQLTCQLLVDHGYMG